MSKPITFCSAPGCERRNFAHGHCAKHAARIRRHGSLIRRKAANGEVKSWIDAVALTWLSDECLVPPFATGNHGYTAFSEGGAKHLAHRYVCERAHGPPPAQGLQAAHSCGVRRCVNPRHLRWATRAENEADKLIHGTRLSGERHPNRKLSRNDVIAIRESKSNQRSAAKTYGVSQQTISDIRTGRKWSWMT